jgi:hypothetical protein
MTAVKGAYSKRTINLIYEIEIVYVYVHVRYSAKTDTPICTKLGILTLWDKQDILEWSKFRNNVLISSSREGNSWSSETKHDRRTTTRKPKLFVSGRILQKQRPQPRKPVLCSSPGEDCFCSSEAKNGANTRVVFISSRTLQEQRPQLREPVLSSSLGKDDFFSSKIGTIEEQGQDQTCCLFRQRDYTQIRDRTAKKCPRFYLRWRCIT